MHVTVDLLTPNMSQFEQDPNLSEDTVSRIQQRKLYMDKLSLRLFVIYTLVYNLPMFVIGLYLAGAVGNNTTGCKMGSMSTTTWILFKASVVGFTEIVVDGYHYMEMYRQLRLGALPTPSHCIRNSISILSIVIQLGWLFVGWLLWNETHISCTYSSHSSYLFVVSLWDTLRLVLCCFPVCCLLLTECLLDRERRRMVTQELASHDHHVASSLPSSMDTIIHIAPSISIHAHTFESVLTSHPFHPDTCKNTSCGVCLENFVLTSCPTQVETLHCKHAFHSACIRSWLPRRSNCPLCRAPAIVAATAVRDDTVHNDI